MNCQIFSDSILFFLDNELSKEESKAFTQHRATCSSCREAFNQVSATYQLIEMEKNMADNPFFYHKLKTKLAAGKQEKALTVFMQVLKPLAVAASIALGIMIGNGELALLETEDETIELAAENIDLLMPADYSLWMTLNDSDGSEN